MRERQPVLAARRTVVVDARIGIERVASRTAIATACGFAAVAAAEAYALDPLVLADSGLAQLRAGLEWLLALAPLGLDYLAPLMERLEDGSGRRGR